MIDLDAIHALCSVKRRVHGFVDAHRGDLVPRDWTDGLEKPIEIDGEPWSYSRTRTGWQFTCRRSGQQVVLRRDGRGIDACNCRELTTWLRSHDERYDQLNEIAVENWVARAHLEGLMEEDHEVPGYFRPKS